MRRNSVCVMCLALLVGCEEASTTSTSTGPSSSSRSSAPPGAADVNNASVEPIEGNDTPAEDDGFERQVAEAGVGKRGRNYGGGVISEPIKQYFQASQRINLLNMTHAMKLYKAEHGRLPKTHDEFMEKIIKINSIELPELPEGERYVYDPKLGELMVERPKR